MLTDEVNRSSRPIEADVHRHLLRHLDDVAHSGHGWAAALDPERSAGHIYFSAGFADDFRRLADADPALRLPTLGDLDPPT